MKSINVRDITHNELLQLRDTGKIKSIGSFCDTVINREINKLYRSSKHDTHENKVVTIRIEVQDD